MLLKRAKDYALRAAKSLGVFSLVARSRWRRQRLVILGYHGLSLRDEHKWDRLFMEPRVFRQRLEILARGGYRVLPLAEAVERLRTGALPPQSVALTFDDGFYDFYEVGFPMLRDFGFPATVYQTTYYCDHRFPIFSLVLNYLFWRGSDVFRSTLAKARTAEVREVLKFARHKAYSIPQRNELAAHIAAELGVDYCEIRRLRLLHLMSPAQLAEVAAAGIDVQLHTHRHRAPVNERLFVREIRDNRDWLADRIGARPSHFCYPNGVYHSSFLPWLRAERVVSATTCDLGIATREHDPLLLPRLVDAGDISASDFEGWLSGVSSFLPRRPAWCDWTPVKGYPGWRNGLGVT